MLDVENVQPALQMHTHTWVGIKSFNIYYQLPIVYYIDIILTTLVATTNKAELLKSKSLLVVHGGILQKLSVI